MEEAAQESAQLRMLLAEVLSQVMDAGLTINEELANSVADALSASSEFMAAASEEWEEGEAVFAYAHEHTIMNNRMLTTSTQS